MSNYYYLVTAVALSCSLSCFAADDDFILDAAMQSKVLAHVPPTRVPLPLARSASVQDIDHKSNFNVIQADQRTEFATLENGLIGTRSSTAFRSGKGQGSGKGMTLCGLILLVAESSSTSNTSVTTVLPVGKLFLPFGIKSSVDFNTRLKLVAFEASIPSVCAISPGLEFTYRTEIDAQTKSSGLFGGTTSVRRTEAANCKTAATASLASQIFSTLSGEYLAVTCDVVIQSGAKKQVQYAFLRESSMYIGLEQIDEWQKAKTTYTELEYVRNSGGANPFINADAAR